VPIYSQTYRTYDGTLRRHFRWWTVAEQELRLLARARIFKGLVLIALLHCLFYVLIILLNEVYRSNQELFRQSGLGFLTQVREFMVDERLFYMFLRFQSGLAFLILIYAGSGAISNDFVNNLMEVYFAKPLTWIDYTLGKCCALVLLGLSLTALPAVLFLALHNALLADLDQLAANWWWGPASVGFASAIVVPAALCVLAASALSRSQRYAAIAVFMVVIASSTMGVLLAQMLRDPQYLIVSVPMVVNRIGLACFRQRGYLTRIDLGLSLGMLVLVCVTAFWIICRAVRRAEVAA